MFKTIKNSRTRIVWCTIICSDALWFSLRLQLDIQLDFASEGIIDASIVGQHLNASSHEFPQFEEPNDAEMQRIMKQRQKQMREDLEMQIRTNNA